MSYYSHSHSRTPPATFGRRVVNTPLSANDTAQLQRYSASVPPLDQLNPGVVGSKRLAPAQHHHHNYFNSTVQQSDDYFSDLLSKDSDFDQLFNDKLTFDGDIPAGDHKQQLSNRSPYSAARLPLIDDVNDYTNRYNVPIFAPSDYNDDADLSSFDSRRPNAAQKAYGERRFTGPTVLNGEPKNLTASDKTKRERRRSLSSFDNAFSLPDLSGLDQALKESVSDLTAVYPGLNSPNSNSFSPSAASETASSKLSSESSSQTQKPFFNYFSVIDELDEIMATGSVSDSWKSSFATMRQKFSSLEQQQQPPPPPTLQLGFGSYSLPRPAPLTSTSSPSTSPRPSNNMRAYNRNYSNLNSSLPDSNVSAGGVQKSQSAQNVTDWLKRNQQDQQFFNSNNNSSTKFGASALPHKHSPILEMSETFDGIFDDDDSNSPETTSALTANLQTKPVKHYKSHLQSFWESSLGGSSLPSTSPEPKADSNFGVLQRAIVHKEKQHQTTSNANNNNVESSQQQLLAGPTQYRSALPTATTTAAASTGILDALSARLNGANDEFGSKKLTLQSNGDILIGRRLQPPENGAVTGILSQNNSSSSGVSNSGAFVKTAPLVTNGIPVLNSMGPAIFRPQLSDNDDILKAEKIMQELMSEHQRQQHSNNDTGSINSNMQRNNQSAQKSVLTSNISKSYGNLNNSVNNEIYQRPQLLLQSNNQSKFLKQRNVDFAELDDIIQTLEVKQGRKLDANDPAAQVINDMRSFLEKNIESVEATSMNKSRFPTSSAAVSSLLPAAAATTTFSDRNFTKNHHRFDFDSLPNGNLIRDQSNNHHITSSSVVARHFKATSPDSDDSSTSLASLPHPKPKHNYLDQSHEPPTSPTYSTRSSVGGRYLSPFLNPGNVLERAMFFEKEPQMSFKQRLYQTVRPSVSPTPLARKSKEIETQAVNSSVNVAPNEPIRYFSEPSTSALQQPLATPSRPSSTFDRLTNRPVQPFSTRLAPKKVPAVNVPQFYFPRGRPVPQKELQQTLKNINAAFKKFPGGKVSLKDMAAITQAAELPLYWKRPLFSRSCGSPQDTQITFQQFAKMWTNLTSICHDDASRFMHLLAKDSDRDYLIAEDFEPLIQDVIETHPGLCFLREAQEFHSRYVQTVIARIFFSSTRPWLSSITAAELRKSSFLKVLKSLESENDINVVTEYFSYEHFYVIYCKFWELDRDHDLLISRHDLARHNEHAISNRVIDRIFSGTVTRGTAVNNGTMSYKEFVWFLIAEEDKKHPTSIEYWFRVMDLDGDGYLSFHELEFFYEEMMERLEQRGYDSLPFVDMLCQCLDIVKPVDANRITVRDLKRSSMANVFFDMFVNVKKYIEWELREGGANRYEPDGSDCSDWERYAAEEYESLVQEETGVPADDNITIEETSEEDDDKLNDLLTKNMRR